jgi:hypothetical protein
MFLYTIANSNNGCLVIFRDMLFLQINYLNKNQHKIL